MKIKFTRHAKRRAKLYQISESIIAEVLGNRLYQTGRQEIIRKMEGFPYPIKIIYFVEPDLITVISTYPLKKGLNNESPL
jgi:hypothetical protein